MKLMVLHIIQQNLDWVQDYACLNTTQHPLVQGSAVQAACLTQLLLLLATLSIQAGQLDKSIIVP